MRTRAFWALSRGRKLAICEAALLLAIAQILIHFVHYRRWAALLGPIQDSDTPPAIPNDQESVATVAWAITAAARRLPWTAVCLPRAMCAKWMLRRRNILATLHIGIRRNASDLSTELHAWLSVGDTVVMGGEIADRFVALARYRYRA